MPRRGRGGTEQDLEEESRLRPQRRYSLRFSEGINYPKSVIFIVGNEFCERFTYYGIVTILSPYLKNNLNFSDDTSTVVYHIFIMFCYFFPLLGAIIADSWLGKFKTVLYMSIAYATGDCVITAGAIPSMPAMIFTLLGLSLMAAGAGSIKPCVAAFGGDQFVMPEQESHLKRFFSLFYFTINTGSFISTIVTPLLRQMQCLGQRTCYSLAFGVPSAVMLLSIVIFAGGTRLYKIRKPDENIIAKVFKCIVHAIRRRKRTAEHWLDKAADKYDQASINDIKAALRVLVLYIPLPFFWALFDQQGSRWTFQASRMSGDIGTMKLNPDQMQVLNPILILVFIPLFEAFLYPSFERYNLLQKPLQKLTVGGLLASLAFVLSAIVEYKLEETYAVLPKAGEGQIRVYNALPEVLNLRFIEPHFDQQRIESMGFWKKYDVPAKGEAQIKIRYTVKGSEKTDALTVFENSLTSYIVMADRIVQIQKDDPDKSSEGLPKIMIIYAEAPQPTTVSITGCTQTYDFLLTKEKPYSKYEELVECESNVVLVNGKVLFPKVELSQGGVYVICILENEGLPKANLLTVVQPNSVHMLWLVPQYVTITAAEVMFSITGLEFSYTQAPVSMKALLQAAWLTTIAVGNLIVAMVAQWKIFERQFYEFLLFAGLMAFDMFIFAIMAMRYTYVVVGEHTDIGENEEEQGKTRDR